MRRMSLQVQDLDNSVTVDTDRNTADDTKSSENLDIFSGFCLGKWNVLFIAVVCLQNASSPTQFYSSIFVNMPIDFRCNNKSNDIAGLTNTTFDNSCSERWQKIESSDHNDEVLMCSFDKSQVSSTFTSEFQLICEKSWLSSMFSLILPIGGALGTIFVGASDKWGRVKVIQVSSMIQVAGAVFVGLASYDFLVLLGRFILGLTHPILIGSAIALSLETMSPKYRSSTVFLTLIPFFIFVMLLGILAYFVREWRMLYIITSIPIYSIPFLALFLDESPRWLIQQGRVDEAKIVMQKAAKVNNINSDFDLSSIEKSITKELEPHEFETNYFKAAVNATKKLTCNSNDLKTHYINSAYSSTRNLTKELYGTTIMSKISFIVPSIWFLSAIVYYGVPLNANSFTSNPYLYILMIGAVECPAAFLGPLAIKRFGYIKTGITLFIITGGCMLGTLFVPDKFWWVKWILAMTSVSCSGASVTICNMLTSELFPTILRTTGYGLSLFAYYVGFFIASFINSSIFPNTWWTFNTLCGISCIIAAILISLLPETHGKKLIESVNDLNMANINKHKNIT